MFAESHLDERGPQHTKVAVERSIIHVARTVFVEIVLIFSILIIEPTQTTTG